MAIIDDDPDEGGGTDPDPDDGGGTDPDPDDGGGTDPDPDDGGGTDPDPDDGGGENPDEEEPSGGTLSTQYKQFKEKITMNSNVKPYPHYKIDVEDRSIYEPVYNDILPIHRPIYAMRTEQGPAGVPVWCKDYSTAVRIFGKETFNMYNNKYYSRSAHFLNQTFQDNGAFIARLVDSSATAARIIFEISMENKNIVQYEKDIYGNRVVDSSGNYVPAVTGGGATITEPGVEIAWHVRHDFVTGEEDIFNLPPRTVGSKTYYPMFALSALNVGSWGNNTAVSFYYDPSENQQNQVDRVKALFYTFKPYRKMFGDEGLSGVRDKYGNVANPFVVKPNAVDSATTSPVTLDDHFEKVYDGTELPYRVIAFYNNFLLAGNRAAMFEKSLFGLPSSATVNDEGLEVGYLVNLISGRDLENRLYDHIAIVPGTNAEELKSNTTFYLANGDDGDISDEVASGETLSPMDNYVRQFFTLDINPNITDSPRYPFTHVFDTGYPNEVKYTLIDFLSIREDVKAYISTQNSKEPMNTPSEDESMISTLRARALLMRESIVKGTSAARATIMPQCGIMEGNYKVILPTTLWTAIKHAEYQNRDFMDREPKGLPYSEIDIFKEYNWIPSSEEVKSRTWDNGANYCQYYTMKNLHYPSLRSIYKYDTSVLVDDTFTDAIVYTKHEVRQSWAKFAGTTFSSNILHDKIEKDLTQRLEKLYNGKYEFTVKAYQTEEQKKLGFVTQVDIIITSPGTNRVWVVDIVVKRENFNN
jgi:hypothetical protein